MRDRGVGGLCAMMGDDVTITVEVLSQVTPSLFVTQMLSDVL